MTGPQPQLLQCHQDLKRQRSNFDSQAVLALTCLTDTSADAAEESDYRNSHGPTHDEMAPWVWATEMFKVM